MNAFIGTLNPNPYSDEQIVYTPAQLVEQRLIRTSQYAADLLVAIMHLLDDADPKSPAAIKARALLKKID
jgi:hypothetical protein